MSHLKFSVYLTFIVYVLCLPQMTWAAPISIPYNDTFEKSRIIKIHTWEELEEQRRQGAFGPEKRQREFRRDGGGWREFKRKHQRAIRRFQRNKGSGISFEKSAYLYYNYNYGYISDNCQFIKGPVRYCWFENSGKKECEWRRKWIYSCY